MTAIPDLTKATASAATPRTKTAAAPRIKLSPQGFCIDHPDPERGERLMAETLGGADPDAMHGILRQLVRASVTGEKPDAVNLAFMLAMMQSIKPRDCVEAMLVAQMVSVHVMTMRCAHHLAGAQDTAQQDSAGRTLGRLARTFPAQIEALNRHRSKSEPAITVQNVSVSDGGNAIVGNVTPVHGGAPGSGPRRGNRNARKHGLFTRDAIAERKQVRDLLGEARRLLREME